MSGFKTTAQAASEGFQKPSSSKASSSDESQDTDVEISVIDTMEKIPQLTKALSTLRFGEYIFSKDIADNVFLYKVKGSDKLVVVKTVLSQEAVAHKEVGSAPGHPHIIRFLDMLTREGRPIPKDTSLPGKVLLVMGHANAGSFHDLVLHATSAGKKLPAKLCFYVLRCVLEALNHLHIFHGIFHMDTHLGNIALHLEDGCLKVFLIDFGILQQLPDLSAKDWPSCPSPSAAALAREIFGERDVFDADFLSKIRLLKDQATSSLSSLQELEHLCASKCPKTTVEEADIEDWLMDYLRR